MEGDLKKGISEKESMKYFLVFSVFWALSAFNFIVENPGIYDYLSIVIITIFVAVEIFYLFTINKGDKWKDFLSRYFAVGFVVFIRSIVFVFLPLIIVCIILFSLIGFIPEKTTVYDLVIMLIYLIAYLFLQVRSFKRINS